MIIRSLELEDFRRYRGVHRIDLGVDWGSDRNVILIGGLNGNGKTSLMIALRLALFGKLNDDLWRRTSYRAFIRNCLNITSASAGKREFGLAVELDTGDVEGLASLRVERRWRLSDTSDSVSESIRLFSNGRERLDLSPEQAELLVLERMPYGMSRFIFFDGDRLQDLVHQDAFGPQVREAVQSIFGLKLYQDLCRDLEAHERSLVRANSDDVELQSLMLSVDRCRQALEDIGSKKDRVREEFQLLHRRLSEVHDERVRLGINHQIDRNGMDQQLAAYRTEREHLQQQLSSLVSLDLPMLILYPQLQNLRRSLEAEASSDQETMVRALLDQKRSELLAAMREVAPSADPAEIARAWEGVFAICPSPDSSRYRHLSLDQKFALINQIDSLESATHRDVKSLLDKLESVEHRIRKLQSSVRSLPDDGRSIELEEEERRLLTDIAAASHELGSLAVEERLRGHELAAARRAEENAKRRQLLREEIQRKVDAERGVVNCLKDFTNALGGLKVREVEQYMTRMFHQLTRDDQTVRSFALDRDTYEVRMTDDQGRQYDLDMLSEGEKEIFVLSFLWAVSMAAVEELPMVVDTPLGRLDSVHRGHIAESFFPAANRQMIILSTDTEIDTELFARLRPFIAKVYKLETVPSQNSTVIRAGYFGEGV